tara:strand:+ start:1298 stop:1561 length:264 start_codon:yes stop_codon:yes gene_type:complete
MSTKRNYSSEYENYQGTETQKKNRAKRNAARRKLMRDGKVSKGDGKDVDHSTPISKGGGNGKGNLRVMDKEKNRSFKRNPNGSIKKQ